MSHVEIERDGPIARVWFNRPEQHNALSPELADGLVAALKELTGDPSNRIVVLGGRGASFCAGADIAAMKASAAMTLEENLVEAEKLGAFFAAIADFPRPVIARVQGNVLGGGVGLACACDITVASDDAKFGLTEVRLGIIPALISPYVIRRLGDRHARELMLTGERFGTDVALRVGIAHHVVPAAELDAKIAERCAELLKAGPEAQRRVKLLLELWADSSWDDYREALPRVLAEVRRGEEAQDGLSSFFEKRKPRWLTPPAL